MDAEDGPQLFPGPGVFPFRLAIDGLILAVGLHNAEIQVPGHNGVDVKDGSGRGFNGAANTVDLAFFVNHFADGAARRIIYPRNPSRTDGGKSGFRIQSGREQTGGKDCAETN